MSVSGERQRSPGTQGGWKALGGCLSCRSPAFWEGPAWLELGATEWLGRPVSTWAGAAAERPSPGTCNHCQETHTPMGAAGRRPAGPRTLLAPPTKGYTVPGCGREQSSEPSQMSAGSRPGGGAQGGPGAPCCPWVPSAQPCARSSTWAPSAGHAAEDTAPPGGQPHGHRGPAPSPPLRARLLLGWRAGSPTCSLWGPSVSRIPGTGPPRHSSPELSPPGLGRQRGPRGRRRRKGAPLGPKGPTASCLSSPFGAPGVQDSASRQRPRAAGP